MKKNFFVFSLILFISSIVFIGCDDDDDSSLGFLNKNYKSTVTYPNGKQFNMTTQFFNNDRYVISITVPYELVVGEENEYIRRMTGKFDYAKNGSAIKIKLHDLASIDYGYTGGESNVKDEIYLPRVFPTMFTLKDKKLISVDSETGIVITAR